MSQEIDEKKDEQPDLKDEGTPAPEEDGDEVDDGCGKQIKLEIFEK